MPAANLALEDVNARKDLLPGYVLKLHSNDSEVSDIYWTVIYFINLFKLCYVYDKNMYWPLE